MSVFNPEQPYNELPLLPPSQDIESKAILRQCIDARASLSELKQIASMLPNQAVLINTLPLLEAQASSEIENIVTTTDKLFQFANSSEGLADHATKEALRYRTALREGFESIVVRPLSTATAVKICTTIKGVEMDIRKVSGTTLSNHKTGKVIYTPPVGESILRDKLKNLEDFLHAEDIIDPLIKMAIGHYQLEAIHPFTDGNGRTGRIFNILYLIEKGLLDIPVLYLSRYIIENKKDYYNLLLKVTREQDWESWILYMLKAVAETARWTADKIRAILILMEETRMFIRKNTPQIYSRELSDLLFIQPYCRISNLVDADIAKRQTASQYLKRLVEIGVLKELSIGREKVFVNPRFMELLMNNKNEYEEFTKITAV